MPFRWTQSRETAAQLVAEGSLGFPEIAERVGVARQTLFGWRQAPEFKARVEEALAEIKAEIRRIGIGTIENRVRQQDDRWNRMRRVIDERAAEPEMAGVPGGTTGLLVRTLRRIIVEDIDGNRSSRELVEYQVDTGLLREIRELEKHAAQELGQWQERQEITGTIDATWEVYEEHARRIYGERPETEAEGEPRPQ
jgi:hypothetical protein